LSIPVVRKQTTASRGVSTTGSPFTLNDVLIGTGTPACDPLLGDGEGDVTQQAGIHIMVADIHAENVDVLFGHGHLLRGVAARWNRHGTGRPI
jgi:hypothetical protein